VDGYGCIKVFCSPTRAVGWLLVSLVPLAGCVPVPHVHTRTPGADIHITDSDKRPILGAVVHTYTGDVIGSALALTNSKAVDSLAHVTFAYQRQWHPVYGLIPDMEAPSLWGICVDHPDFAPVMRPLPDEKTQAIVIVMTPSVEKTACPPMLEYHRSPRGAADSVFPMR
jgi:hypothetical protein